MIEKSDTSCAAWVWSGLLDLNHTRITKLSSVLQIAKFVPGKPQTETNFAIRTLVVGRSQAVRQRILIPPCEGSIPSAPANIFSDLWHLQVFYLDRGSPCI